MRKVKAAVRKAFYRSGFVRLVVGAGSFLIGKSTPVGISHLTSYSEENSIGPLQRDEAGSHRLICGDVGQ
jgi:hypothetical protein